MSDPPRRRFRLGTLLGMTVLAGMTAITVMWLESGVISPADGDPQARDLLLLLTVVWTSTLAVSAWMGRSAATSEPPKARSVARPAVVAVSTGAVIGAGLFLALMPLGRYDVRWQVYFAAMRSDLRDLARAQAAYSETRGGFATSLEDLEMYLSDGVRLDFRSDGDGWSAAATHVALPSVGFPDGVCVAYGGEISVQAVHRLPNGRIPAGTGEWICDYGAYVGPAER